MSITDRNGGPLVGDILDIIDKNVNRYKVAIAIAEFIRKREANPTTKGDK